MFFIPATCPNSTQMDVAICTVLNMFCNPPSQLNFWELSLRQSTAGLRNFCEGIKPASMSSSCLRLWGCGAQWRMVRWADRLKSKQEALQFRLLLLHVKVSRLLSCQLISVACISAQDDLTKHSSERKTMHCRWLEDNSKARDALVLPSQEIAWWGEQARSTLKQAPHWATCTL